MIKRVIGWSIDHRVLVLLLTALLVGVGVYSVRVTPVDAIPDLSDVQVIIKTAYPGQAPQVVEDQVTYPLTTAMLSVPGAVTVRGYSFFGDSYVYVNFDDTTDLYWARSRVLEYLSQVTPSLPAQARPQLGPDATGVGWIFIYALTDPSGRHDLSELRTLQDWFLKYELQTVPGVSEVATIGGMVKQYQITVDPDRLRAFDIPLSLIKSALSNASREVGASVVEMAEAEYMVRASGYLHNAQDIGNVPLRVNSSGTPLLLKDVADITVGPQMRRGIAELNGEGETVAGIIVMRSGEHPQQTIDGVKARLRELQASLPEGVEVVTVYDRSALIERAVNNLWRTVAMELVLVALVCGVFLLHARSAIVAVVSLPVGILAAFTVMHLQGLNANIMSLGGIAIAIGAMIDGAIVMVENLHKHVSESEKQTRDHWQLVAKSSQEVGPALFFSLLIITVSFLPVFALEAQEGRMFAPLAYTKTYAMAAAAILAITLVPVLMGFFIRGKVVAESANPVSRGLRAVYRPAVAACVAHPRTTIALALLLLVSSLWPLRQLGSEFMPELDEGDLMYMPTTYAGISVGKARELLQQTDKIIRTVPEVETVLGKVGRAETATDPAPLTMVETFIQLKPRDQWRPGITPQDIRRELDSRLQLPGLTNAWVMPIKTRIDMLATGIKTPVGIKVAGPDLSVIESLGRDLEKILVDVQGTASVYSERVAGGRYIKVDIDREKAARYGLAINDVQEVVAIAVGGVNVTNTVEDLERYPVNIRYPQSYRDSPEQLALLPIVTVSGSRIALGDVARVYVEDGPSAIKSENARTNGWTYIDITGGDVGSYVERAQLAVAQELTLPPGYSVKWSGQFEYMERAKERLGYVVPLTLGLIVILLYMNFRQIAPVVILMGALPLSLAGSFWLMYALDYNLSIAVGVGLIALAGIAAETGLIMLVYLEQSCAATHKRLGLGEQPLDQATLQQAVVDGAVQRIRPVMMTAGATIIGLLPILLGSGTGSEVMSRLAAPMVGGMVSALVLTLLVLPTLYYVWRVRDRR
ncbi:MAG: CusA/CzcA family heavy metal efflux RND transporter [Halioglobus sp.]